MGLKEYVAKRKFGKTPEPEPTPRRGEKRLVFVVHKHAARALHYDLRLEMEGCSRAGPSEGALPGSFLKRLAIMARTIRSISRISRGSPEGNYGAEAHHLGQGLLSPPFRGRWRR